jgi:hypothetical protein
VTRSFSTPQVLKSLNKTSSKDLAKHLRQAALVFVDGNASSAWLDSDLVPKVLAILRSLPSGRSPKEAVVVCSAAMAVLNNMFTGLKTPTEMDQFRQLLKTDQAACAARVHWGMARPEASEQLSPGFWSLWCGDATTIPESARGDIEHAFYMPLTACCSFLMAVETEAGSAARSVPSVMRYRPQLVEFNVQEAASPAVMERLLRVAVQHPCGACLSSSSA